MWCIVKVVFVWLENMVSVFDVVLFIGDSVVIDMLWLVVV